MGGEGGSNTVSRFWENPEESVISLPSLRSCVFEGPWTKGHSLLLFFSFICMGVQLHICVYATRVPGTPGGRKVSDPLALELWILVIHHVDAGN